MFLAGSTWSTHEQQQHRRERVTNSTTSMLQPCHPEVAAAAAAAGITPCMRVPQIRAVPSRVAFVEACEFSESWYDIIPADQCSCTNLSAVPKCNNLLFIKTIYKLSLLFRTKLYNIVGLGDRSMMCSVVATISCFHSSQQSVTKPHHHHHSPACCCC